MVAEKNILQKTLTLLFVWLVLSLPVNADVSDGWINYSSFKDVRSLRVFDDTLYALTSGGMLVINDKNEPAVEYSNQDGLGTNELTDIIKDANGIKWISGFGRLIRFEPDDMKQYLFFDIENNLFNLNCIANDSEWLWIGTDIGLVLFAKNIDEGQIQDSYSLFGNLNPSPSVNGILLRNDSIYLATSEGLAVADKSSKLAMKSPSNWKTYDIESNPELGAGSITGVLEFNGSVYITTENALFKFENEIFTLIDLGLSVTLYSAVSQNDSLFVYLSNDADQKLALVENDIVSFLTINGLAYDVVTGVGFMGDHWLGTEGLGIFYSDFSLSIEYPFTGLPDNNVYDLTVDKDGMITANFRFKQSASFINDIWTKHDFWIRAGLTKVIIDSSGNPYIGTEGNGLWVYKGDSLANYDELNSTLRGNSDSPPHGETFVYIKDMATDGVNIFFACYRAVNNAPVAFVAVDDVDQLLAWDSIGIENGLTDHFVSSLALYKDELAVASESDGIFRCDIGDDPQNTNIECVHYTKENSLLASNIVRTVRYSPDGVMWVGTNFGLAYLDDGINRFRNVLLPVEISSDINTLEFDGRGNLWIGTKDGLAFRDHNTGFIQYFNTLNSDLPSNYINEITNDPNTGDIYISTTSGYVFVPSQIGPPVYEVEQVLAFPNPFVIDDTNDRVEFNFGEDATVDLFSSAGEKIKQVNVNLGWDGTNEKGSAVASGVYVFVITDSEGNRSTGKILLVRQ